MNCEVLTFYFAHNYGAALQAYALKKYLEDNGQTVRIAGYIPEKLKREYSLSPFAHGHELKNVLKSIKKLPYRFKQKILFDQFIKEYLNVEDGYQDNMHLLRELEWADILICGSDQIWNEDITGKIDAYYAPLPEKNLIKVSYAASFGKRKLSEFQIQSVQKYLKTFKGISLRELSAIDSISRLTGRSDVRDVLDPVFLLDTNMWRTLAGKSRIHLEQKFIVFYSLREDKTLCERTSLLSAQSGFSVYIVHPTGICYYHQGKRLFDVGPLEFLWLILNAEYICTNSFHATAFSIIFEKKLLVSLQGDKSSRIESLFSQVLKDEYDSALTDNVVDADLIDRKKLLKKIENSREYLNSFIT